MKFLKSSAVFGFVFFLIISCQEEGIRKEDIEVISLDKSSGIVGSEVNITGTGFTDEISEITVMFGDFEGSVISSSNTDIVVRVPNGSTKEMLSVAVGSQTADEKFEFTTLDFIDIRDDKRYPIVYIGDQIWFGKNLNYNTPTDDACYNFEEGLCDTDGRFYKWEIAQDICPKGWKVPSQLDYEKLLTTVNYDNAALGIGGNSGFDIIRTGTYYAGYPFNARGEFTNIWTSTVDESDDKAIIFTWPQGSTDFFLKLTKADHACLRCLME